MAVTKAILEKWMVAQKRHRLSDKQVQMARELGLNPDKLGKIDNHKQEPWKAPLPQFIEHIYFKRFKREEPETVKPLKQILKEMETKKKQIHQSYIINIDYLMIIKDSKCMLYPPFDKVTELLVSRKYKKELQDRFCL